MSDKFHMSPKHNMCCLLCETHDASINLWQNISACLVEIVALSE